MKTASLDKRIAKVVLVALLSLVLAEIVSGAETVEGPADWRQWPLAPANKPESLDCRDKIAPESVPAVPAFPGAEGHGALSVGGRGGRVIKVTTLNAKGTGSLDEALRAKGARIVVFDVSGVIRGNFVVTEPNITVAGQTAPGAGVTIEGTFYVKLQKAPQVGNVTLRFLRVRVPPVPAKSTDGLDAVCLLGADRAIVDHMSASWAVDETTSSPYCANVTYQWCSVEESATVGHKKGMHNYGMKGADWPYGFIHHNLMAHHSRRNPSGTAHVINNVVYDVRDGFVHDAPAPLPGLYYASNVMGNYYKQGPSSDKFYPICFKQNTAYYAVDNFIHGVGLIKDPWLEAEKHPGLKAYADKGKRLARPRPYPYFPITIHSPQRACELVLAHAGCLPRDCVSRRTIQEFKDGTGRWGRNAPEKPSDEWYLDGLTPGKPEPDSDGDGMPDRWEQAHGLNPRDAADAAQIVSKGASPADRHAGYTYIEFYVNELADNLILQAMREAGVIP